MSLRITLFLDTLIFNIIKYVNISKKKFYFLIFKSKYKKKINKKNFLNE